jgi:hypothetical protein
MPRYEYHCGACDEISEIVVSIGTARRMRECDCGGIARLRIGVDVNIAPSALENKGAAVRAIDTKEGRWDRDMPAYKRMRHAGMQPASVDGAAALEGQVGDQFDVHYKPLMDRGIPRDRIQEGEEQAKELLEDAGMDWTGQPV